MSTERAATPAGALPRRALAGSASLREVSTMDLVRALATRLGEAGAGEFNLDLDLGVAQVLSDRLVSALDQHTNRFAPRYLAGILRRLYFDAADLLPPLRGANVVEVGCGSWAPLNLGMAFLVLGAETATGVDLDHPEDVPRAVKALAEVVGWLLLDPGWIVGPGHVSRAEMLASVGSFDLAGMRVGRGEAVDTRRIRLVQESVCAMHSLATGATDLLLSNSFLEHVEDLDAAIAEMRRVVRVGGGLSHAIDATDHRRYGNPDIGELDFLREVCPAGFQYGTNRLRPFELVARFEAQGFTCLRFQPFHRCVLTDAEIAAFVEPFSSMPRESLEVTMAHMVFRRVS